MSECFFVSLYEHDIHEFSKENCLRGERAEDLISEYFAPRNGLEYSLKAFNFSSKMNSQNQTSN
jgi:hypothetical protein